MLHAKFCEALALPHDKLPPCPEQWFAFLEATADRWTATFPQCDNVRAPRQISMRCITPVTRCLARVPAQFLPSQWSNQRNDFAMIGTTDVIWRIKRATDELHSSDGKLLDADSDIELESVGYGAVMLQVGWQRVLVAAPEAT